MNESLCDCHLGQAAVVWRGHDEALRLGREQLFQGDVLLSELWGVCRDVHHRDLVREGVEVGRPLLLHHHGALGTVFVQDVSEKESGRKSYPRQRWVQFYLQLHVGSLGCFSDLKLKHKVF